MLNILDIDECISNTCNKNATCKDGINSYTCTCNDGFTGNGTTCTGTIYMMIYDKAIWFY